MRKLLSGMFGVLIIGILVGYGTSWYFQRSRNVAEKTPIVIIEDVSVREIQLYFTDPMGTFLIPENREIPGCDDDRDCICSLLKSLIKGSQQKNLPVLPKETKVFGVEVENDLVRVNFSRQLVDFHPGGSLTELLTIYSLVDSLNENFPYIRRLQILVEGEVRQTLKGHVRIDQPIYADFSFSHPPLTGPVPERKEIRPEDSGLSVEQLIQDTDVHRDN